MKSMVMESILLGGLILALVYSVNATPGVNRGDNIPGNTTNSLKTSAGKGNISSPTKDEPEQAPSDSINTFQSFDQPPVDGNSFPSQFSGSVVTSQSSRPGYSGYALPPPPSDYKAAPPAPIPPPAAIPPPPVTPGGFGGFGGGFPGAAGFGFPGGVGLGIPGVGAGISMGVGGYFPIIEKILVVFGMGILVLLMMAMVSGSMAKGGLLNNFGSGVGAAFSASGSDNIDVGPFHKSGYVNVNKQLNAGLNQRVNQAINRKF